MIKTLSVVIPAYNEEANIIACLMQVEEVLSKLNLDKSEIIVVDDGSKDRTGDLARSFEKKFKNLRVVVNNPNRGYGGSLKAGFEAAKYEFITFVPADNQFNFHEVSKLIETQERTNTDIVSGIRVGGGVDPLYRKINRWGWNTVVRALFGYLASDIDCGFKLFRRSILKDAYIPAERGAMIDTQLFASARAHGYTVSEVPLTHLPRTAGKSTGANLQVIVQSFIDLFVYWWQLKREIMVEKGLVVFRWEALLLILILIIGGISRLYKIEQYMTFLGDEGRDARVMRDIVTLKHIPLLGPGTSIGNMYLGPLYYYLVAPSLGIAGLNPVGPAVEIALIGIVTIALLWWVGRQWFGRVIALGVSLIFAISPVVIIYSRSSWNPNIMPFFALMVIYGSWKFWKYGYWRWLPITAFSLAFALNSHYLGLLLIPPVIIFYLHALLIHKTPDRLRNTLIAIGVFTLLMSPLVIFDFRHDFQNFEQMKLFFTNRESTVNLKAYKAIPLIIPIWNQITASLITVKNLDIGRYLSLCIAVLFLINLKEKKTRNDSLFILVWALVGLVGLGIYKQHLYDHYFGFMFPIFFLILGFAVKWLYRNSLLKIITIVLLASLALLQLANHPLKFSPNNQLSRTREVANDITSRSKGEPFNFALLSNNNYDESYRYFLELNQAKLFTIHEKLTDQLFVICEKNNCQPINNPMWEVAAFGWSKIEDKWKYPWGVEGYKLIHNQ